MSETEKTQEEKERELQKFKRHVDLLGGMYYRLDKGLSGGRNGDSTETEMKAHYEAAQQLVRDNLDDDAHPLWAHLDSHPKFAAKWNALERRIDLRALLMNIERDTLGLPGADVNGANPEGALDVEGRQSAPTSSGTPSVSLETLGDLHELLLQLVGERVRVTTLNGVGREAVHPTGPVGRWSEYPTINGDLVGGEYDNPVRVEVLRKGRYQQVAPSPTTTATEANLVH